MRYRRIVELDNPPILPYLPNDWQGLVAMAEVDDPIMKLLRPFFNVFVIKIHHGD
jgi:hypothetical protein